MGCACKVNQQITYLQKHFGTNQPTQKDAKVPMDLILKDIGLHLLVLPLLPIMFIFIFIRHIFTKKPMNIDKIFKFKKNGGNK